MSIPASKVHAITVTCGHCATRYTYPIAKSPEVPARCPSCQAFWQPDDIRVAIGMISTLARMDGVTIEFEQ